MSPPLRSPLVLTPSNHSAGLWWENIGRDKGMDLLMSALPQLTSGGTRLQKAQATAKFYTWLMVSAWGQGCAKFGKRDRIDFFTKVLTHCPNALRVNFLDRKVTLNLLGNQIDFKSAIGISTFLPVKKEWSRGFLAGRKSLYEIELSDLSKPDAKGHYYKPETDILANAMVNMLVVDKCLSKSPPHDHEQFAFDKRINADDFACIKRGFYKHLSEFTGKTEVSDCANFIYRNNAGEREYGQIPRIITPQTGKGMFDATLPRFGFEDLGRNKDGEHNFVCDMNVLAPLEGMRRMAGLLNKVHA